MNYGKKGRKNYFKKNGKVESIFMIDKGAEAKRYRAHIDASYKKGKKNIGDDEIDKSLSGKRVKVYKNKNTNEVTVVHRGSKGFKDWAVNDAGLLVGYRGKRFKHAQKIQKQAEAKYAGSKVTTVGHSLGGKIAQEVGGKTHTVTYNAPTVPQDLIRKRKEGTDVTDYRTKNDLVSALRRKDKRSSAKLVQLKAHTSNVIKTHGTAGLGH